MTHTQHSVTRATSPTKLAWILAAGLFTAQVAPAATLSVCASGCDHSSIKAAVTAASSGDSLALAPETFNEGRIWINKNLTIRTSSGRATVDGSSDRYVFQILPNATVSFEDLTLRGGTDARLDNLGNAYLFTVNVIGDLSPSSFGGILNQPSGNLVLADNSVVAGNASNGKGGGITNSGGDVVIEFSTITQNIGQRGGGVYNYKGVVSVMNSSFSSNHATIKGGAWANTDAQGSFAFHSSSSMSANTADFDCDKYWDRGNLVDCVN